MTIKKVSGGIEYFKNHPGIGKCLVDPALVKGGGEKQYSPIVFQDKKRRDSEGEKLDFPSTTKQLELKDVKQPEFPSTPFTGEAYSQSFHNPRPSNSVKDGTHVIVQGSNPPAEQAGPFRGEHGPDVQYKGSDYVPKRTKKSLMIAGRKVMIKSTQGTDNANMREYPIDRDSNPSRGFGDDSEAQKRKDWVDSEKMKEKVKAYDGAKKNYAPGNGPFDLAMDAKTAYLGRSSESDLEKGVAKVLGTAIKQTVKDTMDSKKRAEEKKKVQALTSTVKKGFGKFFDDKSSMKVLSDKEIKAKQKAEKEIKAPEPVTRKIRVIKDGKSKGVIKFLLQYTQNQPLAAGFKPLLAHLVTDKDEDEEENLKGPKLAKKAMSSADVYDRISSTRDKNKPISPKLQKLGSRAAKVKEDSGGTAAHDDAAPIHPGVDYKALNRKSDRPNPIDGGKGDDLDYDDVDEKELEAGIKVEQEHVKGSDEDEDEKRVKGADIAMDHLAEDDKYYTKLAEMERTSKEGAKADTKKKNLLKLGEVGKSIGKERRLTETVAGTERMVKIRQETNASPGEMKATQGQLKAYTAKLKAERKKNENLLRASHD